MEWHEALSSLFGTDHQVVLDGDFLQGTATLDGRTLCVVGTAHHAAIGAELALRQADVILDTMVNAPGRPILLLIDTQGQQLRRRDELLGINRAMAHLGCCVDRARRRGHPVIGLVYSQALSGGFITSGLVADACYAVEDAEIRVMMIPAMARVTKLPEQLLTELAKSNPVFSPGVRNYLSMGAVRELWQGELAGHLRKALADHSTTDQRARDGLERGGRKLAAKVIHQVMEAA